MTEREKRERLMAELDGIIARLFSAAVDLAEQKIALDEGKPLNQSGVPSTAMPMKTSGIAVLR